VILAAGLEGGLPVAQAGKTTVDNNALLHVLAAAEANKKGAIENYESGTHATIKKPVVVERLYSVKKQWRRSAVRWYGRNN